jgi:hypothetical protein
MGRIRDLLARGLEAVKNILNLSGYKVEDKNVGRRDWVNSGEWVSVSSSYVSAIRYNKEDRTLSVKFNKGGAVLYRNIQPQTAVNMFSSSSMGKFMHQYLFSLPYEKI